MAPDGLIPTIIPPVHTGYPDRMVVRASNEDIVRHWTYLRSGLEKVRVRQDKHSYWLPEHIRHSCLAGHAEMYFVVEKEDDNCILNGFFVTTMLTDPFVNAPLGLFVWIAYANREALPTGLAYLDELAKQRGCRFIETISPRRGLPRRLARFGWYLANYILRKDLTNG